jgi:beta-lactam-binding protein with PASTA domain
VTRVGLLLVVLILSLAGCAASSTSDTGNSESAPGDTADTVQVPDVTGEDADSAQSDIESANLVASFDPSDPPSGGDCTVDDQDPEGDDSVESGAEVALTISCEVPDVTGADGDEATQRLEDAGFEVSLDSCDDDPGSCTVDDQDPAGGDTADPGMEVALTMTGSDDGATGDNCDPSYEGACLKPDAYDYDCLGGSGDGPEYVDGPVDVVGDDHYGLDRDGDGVGCDQ